MQYISDPSDAVYPLTVSDVKYFLSIQSDDETINTFLANAIRMVCTRVEGMCPFWMYERTVSASLPFYPQDVQVRGAVSRLYAVRAVTPSGAVDLTSDVMLHSTPNGSVVRLPDPPVDVLGVDVVFRAKAFFDDGVRLAVLTAVRNLYLDRLHDPFTEEVGSILYPHLTCEV